MSLGVLTYQERQLQIGKVREQAFVPKRRTLGARWFIASVLSSPWITKPHGKDRNFRFIVEEGAIQFDPIT
jgi:hypothetical protein